VDSSLIEFRVLHADLQLESENHTAIADQSQPESSNEFDVDWRASSSTAKQSFDGVALAAHSLT
jgi:hypothetical protein